MSAILENFINFWNKVYAEVPHYKLDLSWPSVSVIENMLTPLYDRKNFTIYEEDTFIGTVLYLAEVTKNCWECFGAEVEIFNSDFGITIIAKSGPYLGAGETYRVNIERDLRMIITSLPSPFPIFNGFSRVLSPQEGRIVPYALSIFTGLSPAGIGPWRDIKLEDFIEQTSKVVKYLAKTTAENYAYCYPNELLGEVSELYLSGLIFPPTLFVEDLPCESSVIGILSFAKSYKISNKQLYKLALNLSKSVDFRISQSGFVVASALSCPQITPDILAQGKIQGINLCILRPLLNLARYELTGQGEWLGEEKVSLETITFEQNIGFLPWLRMKPERLLNLHEDPELLSAVAELSILNIENSSLIFNRLSEETGDFEIKIQAIAVSSDEPEKILRDLEEIISDGNKDDRIKALNLKGLVSLSIGRGEVGLTTLETCLEEDRSEVTLFNLGLAYLKSERLSDAEVLFEELYAKSPGNIEVILNLISIYDRTEKNIGVLLAHLIKYAPNDPRVFNTYLVNKIQRGKIAYEPCNSGVYKIAA